MGVGDLVSAFGQTPPTKVHRFARFQVGNTVAYGLVEKDQIRQLDGDLFGEWKPGEKTYPLDSVKLLVPVERPGQVIALAGSYKSHLGGSDHVTTVVTTTKVTTNTTSGETTHRQQHHGRDREAGRSARKIPHAASVLQDALVLDRRRREHRVAARQQGSALRGRTGDRHRPHDRERLGAGSAAVHSGRHLRQRRQRSRLAEERRAMVARQGERHVRPRRSVSLPRASTTTTCSCNCGSTARRCKRKTPANSSTTCPSWSVSSASTSRCTRAI